MKEALAHALIGMYMVAMYMVATSKHLPVRRPFPVAPTLPSLYSFHDPAVFSHVAQMWCHFPSLVETEVGLIIIFKKRVERKPLHCIR